MKGKPQYREYPNVKHISAPFATKFHIHFSQKLPYFSKQTAVLLNITITSVLQCSYPIQSNPLIDFERVRLSIQQHLSVVTMISTVLHERHYYKNWERTNQQYFSNKMSAPCKEVLSHLKTLQ